MTATQMQDNVRSPRDNHDLAEELNCITIDLAHEFAGACPPAAVRNAVIHAYRRLGTYTRVTTSLLPLVRAKAHTSLTAVARPEPPDSLIGQALRLDAGLGMG